MVETELSTRMSPITQNSGLFPLRQPNAHDSDNASGVQPVSYDKDVIARPSSRIMRLPDVIARVGLRRSSIYQYMMDGMFPKPVSIGARAVGWLEHEIDSWLDARIQVRLVRKR